METITIIKTSIQKTIKMNFFGIKWNLKIKKEDMTLPSQQYK